MLHNRLNTLAAGVAVIFLSGVIGWIIGSAGERPPSQIDVGFLQDMIVHHDQAVEIALLAQTRSETPAIQVFAREVVIFQRWEIGIMGTLLDRWGQATDTGEEVMQWMGMPMPVSEMSGYADDVELDSLAAATGPEFDARFLTMLSAHHLGGIQMSAFAAKYARSSEVAELAKVIARNQAMEIPEYAATARSLDLPPVPGSPTFRELARLAEVARS